MQNYHHDGVSMWPFPIIMLIIIIIGRYLIFKPKYPMNSRKHEETAMDILKKRHAKGEISKEEFDEIKRDLI